MKAYLFALLALSVSSLAFAQTCPSPGTLPSGGSVSGNTCGGDSSVVNFCGGATAAGPTAVYAFQYNGSASSTITVTPSNGTFDAAIAVVSGGASCAASLTANCNDLEDNATGGGAETSSVSSTNENAAGTYYLLITNLSGGAANVTCGPYNVTAGTLPVKLQKFSVN
jgi:hypothetical protein